MNADRLLGMLGFDLIFENNNERQRRVAMQHQRAGTFN